MKTGLWFDIEAGDTLTLTVTGKNRTNPQFVGGARYVPDVGDDEIWHATPGPYIHTFDEVSGNATVRIGLRFLTTKTRTATIAATVATADGDVREENSGVATFEFQLSGKKGGGMQRGTLVFVRKP